METKNTLKYAFIKTMPVLFGYMFLGIAFGLLLQKAGYGVIWAFLISLIIYAGSMQFVLLTLLDSGVNLLSVALLTLSINSRQIFYGLSFIEKFKAMGKAYFYMIFSLTDETYSLLCSTKAQDGMSEKRLFFTISLLNHSYWVLGSVLGSLIGDLITFDTTGIDFAMTALFVVIFVDQWKATKNHIPAIVGLLCGIISLVLLGPSNFMLPALVVSVLILLLFKNTIGKSEVKCDE